MGKNGVTFFVKIPLRKKKSCITCPDEKLQAISQIELLGSLFKFNFFKVTFANSKTCVVFTFLAQVGFFSKKFNPFGIRTCM
jgi:hypothetical protein